MNKSLIPHLLLALIKLAAVVLLAGCVSPDLYKDGVFDKHSRVKWVYESVRQFYRTPFPFAYWAKEEFTDAGLFGDRLVLCCQGEGDVVIPQFEHIYGIDINTGKQQYKIAIPWHGPFSWCVQNGRLVVFHRPRLETESRYNLKTGLSGPRDDKTSDTERTELNDVTDTLKHIVFQRISEPPGPDRPYESIKDVWVGQMEPGLRLVQEVHPGPRRYNLYLETVSENNQTNRVKLIRLRRFYPSFHCLVGYDSAGDYIIVLRYIVLGVRKTDNSNIN